MYYQTYTAEHVEGRCQSDIRLIQVMEETIDMRGYMPREFSHCFEDMEIGNTHITQYSQFYLDVDRIVCSTILYQLTGTISSRYGALHSLVLISRNADNDRLIYHLEYIREMLLFETSSRTD